VAATRCRDGDLVRRRSRAGRALGGLLLAAALTGCGQGPVAPASPPPTPGGPAVAAPAQVTAPPDAGVAGVPALTASPPEQRFGWQVAAVTAADLPHSWRPGCPVGPEDLRAVTLTHHGFDGQVHEGVLVVHEDVVEPARQAFAALFEQGFPVRSVVPVDAFGGDDDASMAANNTSGFNCRPVVAAGGGGWSQHAYGRAIDVNPVENPYVLAGEVLPPEGAPFTDRSVQRPGMLTAGSAALRAFTSAGFTWGGQWRNPDYQHLQR